MRGAPAQWRKGFSVHKRRLEADAFGEMQVVYDMEHADFTAEDGSEQAICWQWVQSWQRSGQLSSGLRQRTYGERQVEVLQGVCRYELEADCGDRFVVGEGVYELRAMQRWPSHTLLQLERVK